MTDLPELLHDADGGPTGGPDHHAIRARGRRLKAVRAGGRVSGVVAVVALIVGVTWQVLGDGDPPVPPVIGEVDPDPQPRTGEETSEEVGPDVPPDDERDLSALPQYPLLATDGRALFTVPEGASGESERWRSVTALDAGRVVSLAPRPGTDPDSPEAVLLVEGTDGSSELHALLANHGDPVVEPFHATGKAAATGLARSVPQPAWHPDGEHLAWLEDTDDGPVLRVVAWDDATASSGPPEPAEVNELGLPDGVGARLDVWDPEGLLWFTVADGWSWYLVIDFAEDGTVEVARPAQRRGHAGEEEGIHVVAQAAATYVVGVEYVLLEHDSLQLFDQEGHQGLQLPDEVADATPEEVWLANGQGNALVGVGDRAWLTQRPAGTAPIPLGGTITYATAIP